MKSTLTLALLLAVSTAQADTIIGLHIGTRHFDTNQQFNDANPGLYVKTESGFTLGTYKNSEYRQSFYAGKTYIYNLTDSVEFAATAGILTGYKAGVMPFVLPTVAFKYDDMAIRLGYVPKINKQGAQGLHLMLETSF